MMMETVGNLVLRRKKFCFILVIITTLTLLQYSNNFMGNISISQSAQLVQSSNWLFVGEYIDMKNESRNLSVADDALGNLSREINLTGKTQAKLESVLMPPSPTKSKKKTINSTVGKCKCKSTKWPKPSIASQMLNVIHPWYNMTEEESITRHHPNLPLGTFKKAIAGTRCHLMPSLFTIRWINTYWQEALMNPDPPFYLYSAFYDNRPRTDIRPCLRILAMTEPRQPKAPFCYLWFNETGPPVSSKVEKIDFLDGKERPTARVLPFMLSCRIPESVTPTAIPEAVSIVKDNCKQATNILKVIGANEREDTTAFVNGKGPTDKEGLHGWAIAVCTRALFYFHEDVSIRMVEYLEIMKAIGISHVIFHVIDVHPNIIKVLHYYEQTGFVSVIDFSHPPPYINERGQRNWFVNVQRMELFTLEKIFFTDCPLRFMHKYRFIAHHDLDEIPMLVNITGNINALMDHLLSTNKDGEQPSSYRFDWRFHHENIEPGPSAMNLPPFLWFLRHNKHPKPLKYVFGRYKSIYDMDAVTGVTSHEARHCNHGECVNKNIPLETAYLAHYRYICDKKCKKQDIIVEENWLLQYADIVRENVENTMNYLGLSHHG